MQTMDQRESVEMLFSEQLEHCKQLSRLYPQDVVVSKALLSAEKALAQLKSLDSDVLQPSRPGVMETLQTYTQSVLDSTYHRECQLVEGGFPNDIARNVISTILGSFCKAVSLCGPTENIQATLGTELWECINWRIGALMYMYVHELMSSDDRRAIVDRHFLQECCVVGVCHLRLMLSARAPLDPTESYTSHDDTVLQLLQEGIFSDVHMLALMYAGELCYWAWEVRCGSDSREEEGKAGRKEEEERVAEEEEEGEGGSRPAGGKRREDDSAAEDRVTEVVEMTAGGAELQPPLPLFSSLLTVMKGVDCVQQYCKCFSPVVAGRTLLERYIVLAQRPLKDHNWNCARAVELLELLKT